MAEPTLAGAAAAANLVGKVYDLAAKLFASGNANERQATYNDLMKDLHTLQVGLATAHAENIATLKRIGELERERVEMQNWNIERLRYGLQGNGAGGLYYALKDLMKGVEPPHYICPACYQNGKKSLLLGATREGWTHLVCPSCDTAIPTGHMGPATFEYAK